jgi:hypothetical protein
LVLAVAALGPAAALGAAKGTDRPLSGTNTATVIINLATQTGTVDGTGQLSHFGKFTFHGDITLTGTTETYVAANGDKMFTTVVTTGGAGVDTITGGTGRFADASGTFTVFHDPPVTVSVVGLIFTATGTSTYEGQISY